MKGGKNRVASLNSITKAVKIICVFCNVICTIGAIFIFCMGVLVSYNMFSSKETDISKNEYVVDYVSTINHYSEAEAQQELMGCSKGEVFVFDILLGGTVVITGLVFSALLCRLILDFIKDIKDNKTLFTKEKLKLMKRIRTMAEVVLVLLLFSSNNLLMIVIIIALVEIVLYLFNCCVKFQNK